MKRSLALLFLFAGLSNGCWIFTHDPAAVNRPSVTRTTSGGVTSGDAGQSR